MSKTKIAGLVVFLATIPVFSLSSCRSEEDYGGEITKEEAMTLTEEYDYDIDTYFATRTYGVSAEVSEENLTLTYNYAVSQTISMDFSDSSEFYLGNYIYKTTNILISYADGTELVYSSKSVFYSYTEKREDGKYLVTNMTKAETVSNGETTSRQSPAYSEEDITEENKLYYIGLHLGMNFMVYETVESQYKFSEREDTSYFLKVGDLTILGTSEEAFSNSASIYLSNEYSYSYDATYRFNEHGYLTNSKLIDYQSEDETFSISGEMITFAVADGGSIHHTKYTSVDF